MVSGDFPDDAHILRVAPNPVQHGAKRVNGGSTASLRQKAHVRFRQNSIPREKG